MFKRLFILFFYACTTFNCTEKLDTATNEIRIDLTPAHPDTINYYSGELIGNTPNFDTYATEKIKAYPKNYKIKDTFHLHLQSAQKYAIAFQKNEQSRKQALDNFRNWVSMQFDEAARDWANAFVENKEERTDYIEKWIQHVYNMVVSNYTTEYVDCIASICIIENENGKEFVVFDENNDEDFGDRWSRIHWFSSSSDAIAKRT